MQTLWVIAAGMCLGLGLIGCTHTYDGSKAFDEAHPEYTHRPDYFDRDPGYATTPRHFSYYGTEDDND